MRATDEMQSAWTQYWNTGRSDSLPADRAAGHLEAVDAAWLDFFLGFSEGSRLLDLATGGGDVIRAAISLRRNFALTGVDLADLSAVKAKIGGGEFVGNTDLSSLPFPDAQFDGVTSQFGIEYADVAAATREAVRVLAQGGRGLFLLHHSSSPVTQSVVKSLAAYRSVFANNNAFGLGRTVFELHARSASQADIVNAEMAFKGAVGVLQSRLRNEQAYETVGKVVEFLAGLARSPAFQSAAGALRQLDEAEEQIRANNLRKVAQIDAALDRNGIDRFAELLSAAGAVVDPPEMVKYRTGKVLAWRCRFRR